VTATHEPVTQDTRDQLARVWDAPPTLVGWLGLVNHKGIGRRFLLTGLVFFLVGGVFALLMRLQLALPGMRFLDAQLYNELFTMHGVTMAFLFIVPVLEGFAIFVLPLMVGARDLPLPRLTAFGYWVYLLSGIFLYSSFLVGAVPDGGWYAYVPFTGPEFSPGLGMDFWLLGITFLEISAISAGIEILVLLFRNRAPGMSISRMPLFAWSMLVTSFIIIFAFPTLIVGSVLLELDRKVGTVFYNPDAGGSVVLWQHLFWWFGHPDVYIWLLPGVGILSTVIPVFCRTRLVGYGWVVAATIVAGILSFGVWVHHMFTVGLPLLTSSFFGGATLLFALPSGVQVFAWIATLWRGAIAWTTSMLFAVGAVVVFVFGGISGVTLAVVPFNWQVHDTYYVVAHFHYVLIGGSVMPMFAAAYFWWPQLTGRLLSERVGRWNFWTFLVGLNLTFLPLHLVGFLGMPRRIYTFLPGLGWDLHNLLATLGAATLAVSVALFVGNCVASVRRPHLEAADPWGAATLEWAVALPAPTYNFRTFPVVRSRYPLWDGLARGEPPAHPTAWPPAAETERWTGPLAEPRNGLREVLSTTEIDAVPEAVVTLPQQSHWPLVTAVSLAVGLAGLLADAYAIATIGLLASVTCAVGWAWSIRDFLPIDQRDARPPTRRPREPESRTLAWWGVVLLLMVLATTYAALAFSYVYIRVGVQRWPPEGIDPPDVTAALLAAAALIVSAGPVAFALRRLRKADLPGVRMGLVAAVLIAAAHAWLLVGGPHPPVVVHAYASLHVVVPAFHAVAVAAGVVWALVLLALTFRHGVAAERTVGLQTLAMYWGFLVVGGLGLIGLLTALPYLWPVA
jgi:cytochrome c oxidase subunit I+III